MIHFFPKFSPDAENTPYGAALRASGAEARIFSMFVRQHYRRRFELLLRFYPALVRLSFPVAFRSLFMSKPRPGAVVLSSDVEALVFSFVRCWPGAAPARIVLMPFIFTRRRTGVMNRLRLAYYRFVMRRVSLAICHSELEVGTYERLFAGCGTRFAFVHWGTDVPGPEEIAVAAGPPTTRAGPLLVSAGKSGRDYRTLAAAAAGLPCRVVIVCNDESALAGVTDGPALTVLRNSFGLDYLAQVLNADVVVVPLATTDVSAGQMVFIQAMALGRPLVVTRSPTVADYLVHGDTALLVPPGDAEAMREAIASLLADPARALALGERAKAVFHARLSGVAHLKAVVAAIEGQFGARAAP